MFDLNALPLFPATDANPSLSGLTVQTNHTVINSIEAEESAWTIDRTWTAAGAPYAFNAPASFGGSTLQTLEAGNIFKLLPPDDTDFGDVVVLGTPADPVVITSIHDDSAGGATFPGAMTSPAQAGQPEISPRRPSRTSASRCSRAVCTERKPNGCWNSRTVGGEPASGRSLTSLKIRSRVCPGGVRPMFEPISIRSSWVLGWYRTYVRYAGKEHKKFTRGDTRDLSRTPDITIAED